MGRTQTIFILPLLLLATAAFAGELGRRDIVTSHEARVAQTAREMAAAGWPWEAQRITVPAFRLTKYNGISRLSPVYDEPPVSVNPWLVPVMNGEIRLQKPPLPYWCAAAIFELQGRWSEMGARLVPALLGILSLLPLWGLAKTLGGRHMAWYAVLAWASGYFIIAQFRLAMADPYLAFFTLVAVCAWVRGTKAKGERRKAKTWVLGMCFWLALALGVLAKGPVIFLPVGVAIMAYWVCWRRHWFASPWVHLVGLALFAAVALPWALYVFNRVPHAMEIWRYESIGEISDNVEKARPWWFYLAAMPEIALPWTLVWLLGVWLAIARSVGQKKTRRVETRPTLASNVGRVSTRQNSAVATAPHLDVKPRTATRCRALFPVAWYLVTILLFSILHVKKDTYLLPVMAAEALIVADALRALVAFSRRQKTVGALAIAQALLGVGFAAAVLALLMKWTAAEDISGFTRAAILAAASIATALMLLPLADVLRQRPRWAGNWVFSQTIAYCAALAVFFGFLTPARDGPRSARNFDRQLLAMLEDNPAATLDLQRLPEEVSLYLPLNLSYDRGKSKVWVVLDDPHHTAKPTIAQFAPRLRDAKVTGVRKIDVPAEPGHKPSDRWELFEVTADRSS